MRPDPVCALGRVARKSEPYYETVAASDVPWTSFEYDLLGRVVKTVLPDDTATLNSELTVTYAGLTTTTTNAKGQTQRETRNALDEVIETRDHAGTTVSHSYDAWGQVTKTVVAGTGVNAVTTTMKYDERGRRTQVKDPDRGTLSYEYNGFDELVKQTDAVGNVQTMTYDGLGRMTGRQDYVPDGPDAGTDPDPAGSATWTYDGTNGLGQLKTVTDTESDYTRTLTYDTLGRLSVTSITPGSGADTYYEKQTYDGYGRPHQHFDAARTTRMWDKNVTEVQYNEYGYAHKWVDGVYANGQPKATYRQITGQDARGNVTGEKLGGGALLTQRTFDAETGRITGITSKTALPQERQNLAYTWDVLGNLTQRTDTTGNTRDLTETFTYDTLNRLTSYQVGTGALQTVTYDALGNITYKNDVGNYTYGAGNAGPHAVTKAGNDTFTYDAAGNQLTGAGRALTYNAFNKVSRIVKGNHTVRFAYGPDRSRFKRTDEDTKGTPATTDDKTTTTLYVGSVEKVTWSGSLYAYKRYIAGGVALVTEKHETTVMDGTPTTTETVTKEYLLRDHLGSVSVITGADGALVQEMSYDPWGQRRVADTWQALSRLSLMRFDTSATTRGYTGHEMVDAVGIVHMNGRIYDPRLGRFLQADPIIQFPDFSQSHNRYSYVLNNPLAYTDPSGYFIGKLFKKIFRGLNKVFGDFAPFLSIALLAIPGLPTWVMGSWWNAFQFGFMTGGIATGSLKGALFGGISGAAFYGIGSQFTAETGFLQAGGVGHVLTHGLAGGILAELQGGQFGHGFLAAGLTKAVMGRFSYHDGSAPAVLSRTTIAAMVGGTISRITGGKFANGAITAAMAHLFNAETSAARKRGYVEKTRRAAESWLDSIKRGLQSIADNFIPDIDQAKLIADEVRSDRPGHNNMGDAQRHAEWSRRMYEEINPITSILVGYGHELDGLIYGEQPINEMLMDLHNNAVGRAAAASGVPIDQSELIVIDPSDPYTDTIRQY